MNDINTAGDGMTINGDLERQTLNSGSSDDPTPPEQRGQSANGAASVCTTCDGTGWTHTATKGLTKCKGKGIPHA